jgi:hypothetical protein
MGSDVELCGALLLSSRSLFLSFSLSLSLSLSVSEKSALARERERERESRRSRDRERARVRGRGRGRVFTRDHTDDDDIGMCNTLKIVIAGFNTPHRPFPLHHRWRRRRKEEAGRGHFSS